MKGINISDYPTQENCLFEVVSLIKNADIDKYGYLDAELDLIDTDVFHFLALD